MSYREELIELTGQALNGMLSADSSTLSMILDRVDHRLVAKTAVGIAEEAIRQIDRLSNKPVNP